MPQDLDTKLVLISINQNARYVFVQLLFVRMYRFQILIELSNNVFTTQISRIRYLMAVLIYVNVNAFILFGVYILRSN